MADNLAPDQAAAMLTAAQAAQAAFNAWAADVLAGKARLEGAELDAQRAGFRDGRRRLGDDDRAEATALYSARERIAYTYGYGAGRALPATGPAPIGPNLSDLLRRRP